MLKVGVLGGGFSLASLLRLNAAAEQDSGRSAILVTDQINGRGTFAMPGRRIIEGFVEWASPGDRLDGHRVLRAQVAGPAICPSAMPCGDSRMVSFCQIF